MSEVGCPCQGAQKKVDAMQFSFQQHNWYEEDTG
jgi:hypothetical protein